MRKEMMQQYVARITQANRTELVVITYEIIIESVQEAKAAILEQDTVSYKKEIERARKLIHSLMVSLDLKIHLSHELLRLYRFADKKLVEVLWEPDDAVLDAVTEVITNLKKGFEEVAKEDSSEALMKNTQQLYAGLTYGKHKLDEVFVNVNESSRGFKA